MVLFCQNADPALHQALFDFGLLSNSTPSEETVLALARQDAWIASVTELLVEKESRGGCPTERLS